jgi:zinc protease
MPLSYPTVLNSLDNGLRVVVSEDHSVPAVTANVWVDVGSRHEQARRTGLAHLFEHLMFQGSANVAAGEHFALLMAEGGRVNATTWFDRTNYFQTVPSGALDLALWLEADRQGRLLPALTQPNLDTQRDVVKEEKRQRYDNQPYGSALADLVSVVFPESHPYHHPTIGSMEDLDAVTLETVHEFYRAHYGPNATVVTLCGDVTPEEGVDAVHRFFGGLPPAAGPPAPLGPALSPLDHPTTLQRVGEVPNARLYVGFRLPVANTPALAACSVALDAVAGLAISRLHRRLVRADERATGVSASSMALVDGASLGFIGVDVSDGTDPRLVEDVVCAELDRFAEDGPTAAELEASLADTERHWLETLASPEERADLISRYTMLHDDPDRINTVLDTVIALTASDVQEAAATWLRPGSRATVGFVPADDRTSREAAS